MAKYALTIQLINLMYDYNTGLPANMDRSPDKVF